MQRIHRTFIGSLAAIGLAFSALPARAESTFLGNTGLLYAPTSATVGNRMVEAHAYFHDDFNAYGALLGITDRFEIGLNYMSFNSDCACDDDAFLLNLKYRVVQETLGTPAVAVGVVDLLDELDVDPSWFAVASKSFPKFLPVAGGVRVHFGYGGGLYDDKVFGGFEIGLGTPLDALPSKVRPKFSFMGEVVASNFNIGVRGSWSGFAATIALFDGDQFGGGLSYKLSLK